MQPLRDALIADRFGRCARRLRAPVPGMSSPAVRALVMLAAAVFAPVAGAQVPGSGLEVVEREVVRTVDGCDREATRCSDIVLRYPEIVAAPTSWAREGLPEVIRSLLGGSVLGEFGEATQGLDAMFEEFAAEERAFREEFPEFEMSWSVERTVSIPFADGRVVSLLLDEYSYLGGAHPNTMQLYRSYDLRTGEPVSLNAIFSPAALAELERLAEAAFRRARGVPPGASLEEEGFWFEGGQFSLNDNWAIVDGGLLFYYNSYEVASYAAGPTEVRLPAALIAPLALPGSLLSTDS